MRRVFLAFILVSSAVWARAEPPMDACLIGIWATEGSEFRGEAIIKGKAIYLDTDGVGGVVGAPDYSTIIGARLVVTSWNSKTRVLAFDLTDSGTVIKSMALIYDTSGKTFHVASDKNTKFYRHSGKMSAMIRESLGLEKKAASQ